MLKASIICRKINTFEICMRKKTIIQFQGNLKKKKFNKLILKMSHVTN